MSTLLTSEKAILPSAKPTSGDFPVDDEVNI